VLFTDPRVWSRGAGRALMNRGWRLDGEVRERAWLGVPIRELRYRIELPRPPQDGT